MNRLDQLARLARTTRQLSPAQVGHRVRLRAQKQLYRTVPEALTIGTLRRPASVIGWPAGFIPLDQEAQPEPVTTLQLAQREFNLVGEAATVTTPADWNRTDLSQLWRYHLHYFEWAWALVDADKGIDTFTRLWRSWQQATTVGHWDAWSPYVASLRAWALCGLHRPLIEGSPVEDDVLDSLTTHAGYLRANLELDVGGNHLIKNLKALAGLGVFFDDQALLSTAARHLERQVAHQVLPDGGHFERSPSYHAQVLGDLIDLRHLLEATDRPAPSGLQRAIEAMRTWLSQMLLPDGTVPLFKDCVPVSPERLAALGATAPAERPRLTVLADSGYVIACPGERLHAVLDVGQPCPPELPAHAQADSLTWVLSIDDEPAVVDTGTSTYQDLARRAVERSTAAHNTVEVDGQDSTEVWGSFRAGRRARITLDHATNDAETIEVSAHHDGYRNLPGAPVHQRTWRITNQRIELEDHITGGGAHRVTARIHRANPELMEIATDAGVSRTETAERAEAMSRRIPAVVHRTDIEGELPLRLVTVVAPSTTSA